QPRPCIRQIVQRSFPAISHLATLFTIKTKYVMENTMKKLGIALMAIALVWSCGKDDGPDPSANSAPVIDNDTFNVSEDIDYISVIGTVTATDADGDKLTFAIKTNDSALFELFAAGTLTVAKGKSLSHKFKAQHSITVEGSDGDKS